MKNYKVGKKLAISYITIMFLLILGSIVNIRNLIEVGERVESFYDGPFNVRGSVNSVSVNFESLQKSMLRAIANEDSQIIGDSVLAADESKVNIQAELPVISEHFLGDQQIVEELDTLFSEVFPMNQHVLELASKNQDQEALDYMEAYIRPVNTNIRKNINLIITSSNNKGIELINAVRQARTNSIVSLAVLTVLSIGISVGFALYITRSITRPISELEQAAEWLASGKMHDVSITYNSGDELGGLADSMRITIARITFVINDLTYLLKQISESNFAIDTRYESEYVGEFRPLLDSIRQMTTDLSDTIKQINSSADQVAGGSEQVSYGAQELAAGSSEQALTVETLADTISRLAEKIGSNAYDASNANKKAGVVGHEMEESNERMKKMLSAMDDISSSSEQIKKIIDTIEEIAFQTNILALNAKVEAARAGVSGKGFAVIADEVQQLSAKSKEATRSTSALISESLSAVENGLMIANETADSLQNVVIGVKEIVAAVENISAASSEQSESVEQLTQNISQIAGVVQNNSATAEESAAASEELSGQAETLKNLISAFRLK